MRVSQTRNPKLFNYSLTGQVLEEVMDAKYLGVTLSYDLEVGVVKTSFRFCVATEGCPEKLKQIAYFSLIRSFMEYGTTVWDPYQSTTVIRLRECNVKMQGLSKVGIQDTLVFLICLMCWGGCLFLKKTRGSTYYVLENY